MKYKTELHAHSSEVSSCANASASYLVGRYLSEGYSALVLTNHWNRETFASSRYGKSSDSYDDRLTYFLSGYRKAQVAAEGTPLTVLPGMELRLTQNNNDYLLYGITEPFLRAHPDFENLSLEALSHLTGEHGILLVQAHPLRDGMTVISPSLIDGYEVYNGLGNCRNPAAYSLAQTAGKIMTSGSDFHDPENSITGGILTDEPIRSTEQLISVLRNGTYRVYQP